MRIQNTPFGSNPFKRGVAIITMALFLLTQLFSYAPAAFAKSVDITVQGGNPSGLHRLGRDREIRIPPELGLIEESFHGTSGKTILFIQDAHDSLEAQENTAKIINHLVSNYGIKTVFEEDYEGPVPTDKYFGFIKDPKIKEKVSYFLMDHLRVGGAEYAHINRTKDFNLVGADSLKLHKENIDQYRLSATKKDAITKDLRALEKELKSLADSRFPKELKAWLKTKEQYDAKKLDLFTYLGRTMPLLGKHGKEEGLGLIRFILGAIHSNDPVVIEKAKHIDAREVFSELIKLEQAVSGTYLHDTADKQLFEYYKILSLLNRLNELQVSQEEYEAVKTSLKAFDTDSFARFIFSQAPKTLILSRMWERNIRDAIKFYEIAQQRDLSLGQSLDKYLVAETPDIRPQTTDPQTEEKSLQSPVPASPAGGSSLRSSKLSGIEPAILVYGGFHKEATKRILEAKGISYIVVSPRITKPSPRHEEYYKRLMANGRLSYELPANLRLATRSESRIEIWDANPMLARAELRIMEKVARDMPGVDPQTLGLIMERTLKAGPIRSEVRSFSAVSRQARTASKDLTGEHEKVPSKPTRQGVGVEERSEVREKDPKGARLARNEYASSLRKKILLAVLLTAGVIFLGDFSKFAEQLSPVTEELSLSFLSLEEDEKKELLRTRLAPIQPSREPRGSSSDKSHVQVVGQREFGIVTAGKDKDSRLLTSEGGPCVVLSLYAKRSKTALMAHFDHGTLISESFKIMTAELEKRTGKFEASEWEARFLGGNSNLSANLVMVLQDKLEELKIRIIEQDILGNVDRYTLIESETGEIYDYKGEYVRPYDYRPGQFTELEREIWSRKLGVLRLNQPPAPGRPIQAPPTFFERNRSGLVGMTGFAILAGIGLSQKKRSFPGASKKTGPDQGKGARLTAGQRDRSRSEVRGEIFLGICIGIAFTMGIVGSIYSRAVIKLLKEKLRRKPAHDFAEALKRSFNHPGKRLPEVLTGSVSVSGHSVPTGISSAIHAGKAIGFANFPTATDEVYIPQNIIRPFDTFCQTEKMKGMILNYKGSLGLQGYQWELYFSEEDEVTRNIVFTLTAEEISGPYDLKIAWLNEREVWQEAEHFKKLSVERVVEEMKKGLSRHRGRYREQMLKTGIIPATRTKKLKAGDAQGRRSEVREIKSDDSPQTIDDRQDQKSVDYGPSTMDTAKGRRSEVRVAAEMGYVSSPEGRGQVTPLSRRGFLLSLASLSALSLARAVPAGQKPGLGDEVPEDPGLKLVYLIANHHNALKEGLLDRALVKVEAFCDGHPAQKAVVQEILRSGRRFELSNGNLYQGSDNLDDVLLKNRAQGELYLTRAAHEWAIGSFTKASRSPAIFVLDTQYFNGLAKNGQAELRYDSGPAFGTNVLDPYPKASFFSPDQAREIWVSEETFDRYSRIAKASNPSNLPEEDRALMSVQDRLRNLLNGGKIRKIPGLQHTRLSSGTGKEGIASYAKAHAIVGKYMEGRGLFQHIPFFRIEDEKDPFGDIDRRTLASAWLASHHQVYGNMDSETLISEWLASQQQHEKKKALFPWLMGGAGGVVFLGAAWFFLSRSSAGGPVTGEAEARRSEVRTEDAIGKVMSQIGIDHQLPKPGKISAHIEMLLRRYVDPDTRLGKKILASVRKLEVVSDAGIRRTTSRWLAFGSFVLLAGLILQQFSGTPGHLSAISLGADAAAIVGAVVMIYSSMLRSSLTGDPYVAVRGFFKSYIRLYDSGLEFHLSHELGHIFAFKIGAEGEFAEAFRSLLSGPYEGLPWYEEEWEPKFDRLSHLEVKDARRELQTILKRYRPGGLRGIALRFQGIFSGRSFENYDLGAFIGGAVRKIFPENDKAAFEFLVSVFMMKETPEARSEVRLSEDEIQAFRAKDSQWAALVEPDWNNPDRLAKAYAAANYFLGLQGIAGRASEGPSVWVMGRDGKPYLTNLRGVLFGLEDLKPSVFHDFLNPQWEVMSSRLFFAQRGQNVELHLRGANEQLWEVEKAFLRNEEARQMSLLDNFKKHRDFLKKWTGADEANAVPYEPSIPYLLNRTFNEPNPRAPAFVYLDHEFFKAAMQKLLDDWPKVRQALHDVLDAYGLGTKGAPPAQLGPAAGTRSAATTENTGEPIRNAGAVAPQQESPAAQTLNYPWPKALEGELSPQARRIWNEEEEPLYGENSNPELHFEMVAFATRKDAELSEQKKVPGFDYTRHLWDLSKRMILNTSRKEHPDLWRKAGALIEPLIIDLPFQGERTEDYKVREREIDAAWRHADKSMRSNPDFFLLAGPLLTLAYQIIQDNRWNDLKAGRPSRHPNQFFDFLFHINDIAMYSSSPDLNSEMTLEMRKIRNLSNIRRVFLNAKMPVLEIEKYKIRFVPLKEWSDPSLIKVEGYEISIQDSLSDDQILEAVGKWSKSRISRSEVRTNKAEEIEAVRSRELDVFKTEWRQYAGEIHSALGSPADLKEKLRLLAAAVLRRRMAFPQGTLERDFFENVLQNAFVSILASMRLNLYIGKDSIIDEELNRAEESLRQFELLQQAGRLQDSEKASAGGGQYVANRVLGSSNATDEVTDSHRSEVRGNKAGEGRTVNGERMALSVTRSTLPEERGESRRSEVRSVHMGFSYDHNLFIAKRNRAPKSLEVTKTDFDVLWNAPILKRINFKVHLSGTPETQHDVELAIDPIILEDLKNENIDGNRYGEHDVPYHVRVNGKDNGVVLFIRLSANLAAADDSPYGISFRRVTLRRLSYDPPQYEEYWGSRHIKLLPGEVGPNNIVDALEPWFDALEYGSKPLHSWDSRNPLLHQKHIAVSVEEDFRSLFSHAPPAELENLIRWIRAQDKRYLKAVIDRLWARDTLALGKIRERVHRRSFPDEYGSSFVMLYSADQANLFEYRLLNGQNLTPKEQETILKSELSARSEARSRQPVEIQLLLQKRNQLSAVERERFRRLFQDSDLDHVLEVPFPETVRNMQDLLQKEPVPEGLDPSASDYPARILTKNMNLWHYWWNQQELRVEIVRLIMAMRENPVLDERDLRIWLSRLHKIASIGREGKTPYVTGLMDFDYGISPQGDSVGAKTVSYVLEKLTQKYAGKLADPTQPVGVTFESSGTASDGDNVYDRVAFVTLERGHILGILDRLGKLIPAKTSSGTLDSYLMDVFKFCRAFVYEGNYLFAYVNDSIMMNMVNALLRLRNIPNGISHGELRRYLNNDNPEDLVPGAQLLANYVKQANPGIDLSLTELPLVFRTPNRSEVRNLSDIPPGPAGHEYGPKFLDFYAQLNDHSRQDTLERSREFGGSKYPDESLPFLANMITIYEGDTPAHDLQLIVDEVSEYKRINDTREAALRVLGILQQAVKIRRDDYSHLPYLEEIKPGDEPNIRRTIEHVLSLRQKHLAASGKLKNVIAQEFPPDRYLYDVAVYHDYRISKFFDDLQTRFKKFITNKGTENSPRRGGKHNRSEVRMDGGQTDEKILKTRTFSKQEVIEGIEVKDFLEGLKLNTPEEVFNPSFDALSEQKRMIIYNAVIPINRLELAREMIASLRANLGEHVYGENGSHDFSITLAQVEREGVKGFRIMTESEGNPIPFDSILDGSRIRTESGPTWSTVTVRGLFLLKISRIAKTHQGVDLILENSEGGRRISYDLEEKFKSQTTRNRISVTIFEGKEEEKITASQDRRSEMRTIPGSKASLVEFWKARKSQKLVRNPNVHEPILELGNEVTRGEDESAAFLGTIDHIDTPVDLLRHKISYLLPEKAEAIEHGDILLFGPGGQVFEALMLFKAFPDIHSLTIMDANFENLKKIKEKLEAMRFPHLNRIYFDHKGLSATGYPKGVFDAAYSTRVIENTIFSTDGIITANAVSRVNTGKPAFDNKSILAQWAREIGRILKPEGVYLTDMSLASYFQNAGFKVRPEGEKFAFIAAKDERIFRAGQPETRGDAARRSEVRSEDGAMMTASFEDLLNKIIGPVQVSDKAMNTDWAMNGRLSPATAEGSGGSFNLTAVPAESRLSLPESSDSRYKPRAFILGTFLDRLGKKVTIYAVEQILYRQSDPQISVPYNYDRYCLHLVYLNDKDPVPDQDRMLHSIPSVQAFSVVSPKVANIDKHWEIDQLYPFGEANSELVKRFGGTGAADLIVEYLIRAIELTGADLQNARITEFSALRLFLKQRLMRKLPWPISIVIENSKMFTKKVALDDARLPGSFFDAENVGYVMFKASGGFSIEKQLLRLKWVLGRPGVYTVTRDATPDWFQGQRVIQNADQIEVNFPDAVVTKDGRSIGRIILISNRVFVNGFDRATRMESLPASTEQPTDGAMKAGNPPRSEIRKSEAVELPQANIPMPITTGIRPVAKISNVPTVKPWKSRQVNQDAVFVIPRSEMRSFAAAEMKELLFVAWANPKLRIIVPDGAKEGDARSEARIAELSKLCPGRVLFSTGEAAHLKAPWILFGNIDGPSARDLAQSLGPRLAERLTFCWGLRHQAGKEGFNSFGVPLLAALGNISRSALGMRNGFLYDPDNRFSEQIRSELRAYTVISTSA